MKNHPFIEENINISPGNKTIKAQNKVQKIPLIRKNPNDKNTSANIEENQCIFCLTNPPTVILAPCGHQCYCKECYDSNRNNIDRCPICRQIVQTGVEKVFKI